MSLSPTDVAIASINMEECYRRRQLRGRDLNDWLIQLGDWMEAGRMDEALSFLAEAIDIVESLVQYDVREPQPYWFEKAALIHQGRGDHEAAAAVLHRWVAAWPEDRPRKDKAMLRVKTRLAGLALLAQS